MDKNIHKLYMAQILSLIFKDKELCNVLAFKGGTSLMFFHNLNRFSTTSILICLTQISSTWFIIRYALY